MSEHLRVPMAQSLDSFAGRKIADAMALAGKVLPCSVTAVNDFPIVTVAFDVEATPFTLPSVTIPVYGAQYLRLPLKIGDKGIALSADTYLGAQSGLGSGTPNLTAPANLTALVFLPIGNKGFTALDHTKAWLYATMNALLSVGDLGVEISGPNGSLTVGDDLTVSGDATVANSLKVTSAPSGVFISADGHTITVTKGIVTGFT